MQSGWSSGWLGSAPQPSFRGGWPKSEGWIAWLSFSSHSSRSSHLSRSSCSSLIQVGRSKKKSEWFVSILVGCTARIGKTYEKEFERSAHLEKSWSTMSYFISSPVQSANLPICQSFAICHIVPLHHMLYLFHLISFDCDTIFSIFLTCLSHLYIVFHCAYCAIVAIVTLPGDLSDLHRAAAGARGSRGPRESIKIARPLGRCRSWIFHESYLKYIISLISL